MSLNPLVAEFVEVVLLPLDEFQSKIDGEAFTFFHWVILPFRQQKTH